jgi:hypothetical protein
MSNQAQAQLDELLDTRALLRARRKALEAAKITLHQAKEAHRETKELLETRFEEIEQRQGRLFDDEQVASNGPYEPEQPAPARRGRPRKQRDVEGPRA